MRIRSSLALTLSLCVAVLALALTPFVGAPLVAQGGGNTSFEVSGVAVDVSASSAEAARQAGWRLAQRKGWVMLSRRMGAGGGGLPMACSTNWYRGLWWSANRSARRVISRRWASGLTAPARRRSWACRRRSRAHRRSFCCRLNGRAVRRWRLNARAPGSMPGRGLMRATAPSTMFARQGPAPMRCC